MVNRSIGVNAILNVTKTVASIVIPLIIFPYVSRVLGATEIGKYNFSVSIISYFLLIAGLGVSTYAIREGSQYRDNKEKIHLFASEVFTINVIATIISYILLCFSIIISVKLQSYTLLLGILSVEIIFTTIGIQWIYNIYEDFLFITIRTLAFQIVSIVLVFLLVKTKDDLIEYVVIVTLINALSNAVNYCYAKRYTKVSFVLSKEICKHIKPIITIFFMTIAVTIYVSADTTMIGYYLDDYNVGIYSVAVKIYTIIKNIMISVLVVLVPRMSILSNSDDNEFRLMFSKSFNTLITILMPAVIGLFAVSEEIILLIGGTEYSDGSTSLRLLSIALLFSLLAYTYTQCVLIPQKREKLIMIATIVSAITNIVLNLLLIPMWGINGAAFTTVVAEFIVFLFSVIAGRKYTSRMTFSKDHISVLIGSVLIIFICYLSKGIVNWSVRLFTSIVISMMCYIGVLVVMKNSCFIRIFSQFTTKLKRK